MLPCRHIQIFRGLPIPSSDKQIKTICPQTGNTMIVQPQPTVTTAVFTLVGDYYYTTSIVLFNLLVLWFWMENKSSVICDGGRERRIKEMLRGN